MVTPDARAVGPIPNAMRSTGDGCFGTSRGAQAPRLKTATKASKTPAPRQCAKKNELLLCTEEAAAVGERPLQPLSPVEAPGAYWRLVVSMSSTTHGHEAPAAFLTSAFLMTVIFMMILQNVGGECL